MDRFRHVLVLSALLAGVGIASAQAPDNSKMNEQKQNKTQSADQAKNGKTDLELMKEIRRSVVKDKTLSTYAHNVKIIAAGGKVTLKGPVKTADEKSAVVQKATDVAGAGNVTDELTVAGESK
jgi:osmotically-inducible protein OsmY